MELHRTLRTYTANQNGCVLTIGNYDGVHIGHQAILKKLVGMGKKMDLPVVVITFAPNPEAFFQGKNAAPVLTTISSRYFALKNHGVDSMIALPFNSNLSQTTADDFIKEILVEKLNAKYILIGDDFKFGKGRQGSYTTLKNAENISNFIVEQFETIEHEAKRISSTEYENV